VIDHLDPELSKTTSILQFHLFDQKITDVRSIGQRSSGDHQAAQRKAAPEECHHQESPEDEKQFIEDRPPV
jgi:hypothetical protein